jgi:cyanophycinase
MRRERIELPIEWRAGKGWLIAIGGTSNQWRGTEALDRVAIEVMSLDVPIAFVPAANCPPEYGTSFLAAYRRLGAPDGYVVPISDREPAFDAQNAALLREAGLIYFGGGDTTALLASMTDTPALEAVAEAYERGAVICGMSAGAIGLAARGVSMGAGVLPGWGWLPRTLVSVHYDVGREAGFEAALREHPEMLGLGLPEDAALALGPSGQIEWWGDEEIVVKRGARFGVAL